MFRGTKIILQNIPHIQIERWEIFYRILSVPHNTTVDPNNVIYIENKTKTKQSSTVLLSRMRYTDGHWAIFMLDTPTFFCFLLIT